ncbi:hypothetical protein D3C85_1004680 [compost metagenome]
MCQCKRRREQGEQAGRACGVSDMRLDGQHRRHDDAWAKHCRQNVAFDAVVGGRAGAVWHDDVDAVGADIRIAQRLTQGPGDVPAAGFGGGRVEGVAAHADASDASGGSGVRGSFAVGHEYQRGGAFAQHGAQAADVEGHAPLRIERRHALKARLGDVGKQVGADHDHRVGHAGPDDVHRMDQGMKAGRAGVGGDESRSGHLDGQHVGQRVDGAVRVARGIRRHGVF